jgi:hypothetical protein
MNRVIVEEAIDPDLWAIAQILGDRVTNENVLARLRDDQETISVLGSVVAEATSLIQYVIFTEELIRLIPAEVLSRMIELDRLVSHRG